MDRYWLLTWTTYGTWLPGDRRGFVGRSRDAAGRQTWVNIPGAPTRRANKALERAARLRMVGPPIRLDKRHAFLASADLRRTARIHGWDLLALAVMRNHVHVVTGVLGDPDPAGLLQAFKSHSSKQLGAEFGRRPGGRWWTQSGSRRVLRNEPAVIAAVRYVLAQHSPLVVWHAPDIDATWLERAPP